MFEEYTSSGSSVSDAIETIPQVGVNTQCTLSDDPADPVSANNQTNEDGGGVRFVTLKRDSIDATQWKWVICHLGIYVSDVYPDEQQEQEPAVTEIVDDENSDSGSDT